MGTLKGFVVILIVFFSLIPVLSQEQQVNMDLEGKISYVDSAMNNQNHIFENYAGFIEARLYELSDTSYSLEVYYIIDGKYNRHRKPMNQYEVNEFRKMVSEKMAMKKSTTLNQEGRSELLWTLTLTGLGFYAPASTIITDFQDEKSAGIYMLTAAASFLVPYALTKNLPVTDGDARFTTWGALSGIGHGVFLYYALDLDRYYTYNEWGVSYSSTNESALWGLMALTSIGEAIAAYSISSNNNFSAGKADLMVTTSVASTGALPGILNLFGVENSRLLYGSAILGTFSGYMLGNYISNTQNYSRGDASCFSTSWILGVLTPVSLLSAVKLREPKVYLATAIVGAYVGMAVGNKIVKGKDFSTSDGIYMTLGAFGGGAIAGGLSLMMGLANADAGNVIPLIVTSGAIGGFALVYSSLSKNPKIQEKTISGDLKFDFNPFALANTNLNRNIYSNFYSPLIQISYSY